MLSPTIVFAISGCEPIATMLIGISPLYNEFSTHNVSTGIAIRIYIC